MVKWNKLKGRMFERGITQTDIVKAIGRGVNYVCTRINGHKPWTIDEMEIIGELLEIPRDELIDYFFCERNIAVMPQVTDPRTKKAPRSAATERDAKTNKSSPRRYHEPAEKSSADSREERIDATVKLMQRMPLSYARRLFITALVWDRKL